jgi:drug/metabolite transporter (DMT)-like permease
MPAPAVAHLAFIFCCFVWGTSFILLERVTHVFGPVAIGIWRMLSGAAVVAVCWWYSSRDFRLSGRDWLLLIFAALVFTSPPQVIQSYVLHQGFGHSFFGTIVAAVPLLTILVSVPMLRIWPTQRELVGVLGGLACIWLLVEDGMDRGMSSGLLLLAFMIPLASALSNTFIKWKLPHVPAAPLTAALLFVAGLSLVPLEFSPEALESLQIAAPSGASITPTPVIYLLLLGIVASGMSTMVFVWMILKKGPLYAGMTTYVVPVLALLWGVADGESFTSRQILAIAGVLAMVALVQSGSRRPAALEEAIDEAMSPTPLPLVEPVRPAATSDFGPHDSRAAQPSSQVA